MATEKEVQVRIRLKRDTSANWTSADPVLKNGELILVDTAEGALRAKVGDGVKTYTQLPFTDEAIRSLINEKGGKGNTFSLTLMAADWADKQQTLKHELLKNSGYAYLVQPVTEDREAYNSAEIYADDVTVNGQITFHSTETPAANLAVDVLLVEVM